MLHTDPSGFGVNNDGGGGQERRKRELTQFIENNFGVYLDRASTDIEDFTYTEVKIILGAMLDLADLLGGYGSFRRNVNLHKITLVSGDIAPNYDMFQKVIYLSKGFFSDNNIAQKFERGKENTALPLGTFTARYGREANFIVRLYYLVHEMGHAIASGELSMDTEYNRTHSPQVLPSSVYRQFAKFAFYDKNIYTLEDALALYCDNPTFRWTSWSSTDYGYAFPPNFQHARELYLGNSSTGWMNEIFAETIAAYIYAPQLLDDWQVEWVKHRMPLWLK